MNFTTLQPFPWEMTPMNNIAVPTYRDGTTYTRNLEQLKAWINDQLVPGVNDALAGAFAEYQNAVANAEQTVTDAKTDWDTRYDALMAALTAQIAVLNAAAIDDVITDDASAAHATINTLIDAEIAAALATAATTAQAYTDTQVSDSAAALTTALQGYTDDTVLAAIDAIPDPPSRDGIEYNEDFTTRPNGPFTTAPTGQEYSFLAGGVRDLTVTDGFATYSPTADGGGYASVQLDKDITWLGGEFKFTPYTADGGMAVFAATEEDIKVTQNAGQGLPRMSAHFGISPTEITLDVLTTKGTAVTRIFTHPFTTPLTADNTTVYSAWLSIDRKAGIAYIIDPNKEVHAVQHTGLKIPSRWMYFEPFRPSGGATDRTLAKFARVQGESRDRAQSGVLATISKRPVPVTKSYFPNALTVMTLGATYTYLAGTKATCTVPATGRVLARLTAFLDITATGGTVFFTALNETNTAGESVTVGSDPKFSGWTTVEILLTGLTAGSTISRSFGAVALAGAAGSIRYGTDSDIHRYPITVTLTPDIDA